MEAKKYLKDYYSFSQLGDAIADYIKSNAELHIQKVGAEVLKIHGSNVSKRLRSNNLKIKEVDAFAKHLGLNLEVTMGPIKVEGVPTLNKENVMELQTKVIRYMEENEKLRKKIEELKKQIA